MELMAASVATTKLTALPTRSSLPLTFSSSRTCFFLRPLSTLRADTSGELSTTSGENRDPDSTTSSSWIRRWKEPSRPKQSDSNSKTSAIDRIVLRLQNIGLHLHDDEEEEEKMYDTEALLKSGDDRMRKLLRRDWVKPDKVLDENNMLLPWEMEDKTGVKEDMLCKRRAPPPTLAGLTIEAGMLRRLRRDGESIRDVITVPQAGVTGEVLEKIHMRWKKEELVKLKFHEVLMDRVKLAHELVERRTGGFVTWRGGRYMVVFRGTNYKGPVEPHIIYGETGTVFLKDATSANELVNAKIIQKEALENMSGEEAEFQIFLDELGPRFTGWWGLGMPPIDGDLLPEVVPGYRTPFRFIPRGVRRPLTSLEMRNLRRQSKRIPSHFSLSRTKNLQGLAAAIVKLWEKSLIAKIVIKRGVQHTRNKLMALELKMLTGGTLLIRNKYYIVIYRGKDFVPSNVLPALQERVQLLEQVQDDEESIRCRTFQESWFGSNECQVCAGTLAESLESRAQWGRELSVEDHEKVLEEVSRAKTAKLLERLQERLEVARVRKHRAENEIKKAEERLFPSLPAHDRETITDEERILYSRIGVRMTPFLSIGVRGVFDGVVENMHLHWKYREIVKLICYQKDPFFVQKSAKFLEYESGGILVCIEDVPKGYALIFYRGKNYHLPDTIRPPNLLSKQRAFQRRLAMQRYSSYALHISRLEKLIEKLKSDLGSGDFGDRNDMKLVRYGHADPNLNAIEEILSYSD